jgi:conjugal transfer/entry exclusion protein
MRRLRSGESEALQAAADIAAGQRISIKNLETLLAAAVADREKAERQVRDQAREIERLKRELVEARTRPPV